MVKIGVLDIQGSVAEHVTALEKAGAEVVRVKKIEDLKEVAGLVMPGGESITIGKLLSRFGLREAIIKRHAEGMAIWGTCAGAILLAKKISGPQQAESLELMDIEIVRNGYGRQLDSFETQIEFAGMQVPAVFIRAPKIATIGSGCEVLSELKGEITACREGRLMVTTFHPEMTDDLRVHQYFIEICSSKS